MGIFSTSTPFDQVVEKATHETNTKEDWTLILDICDKVGASQQHAKDCLKSIIKRLNHPDPHVELQAITLLDTCVKNCGLSFHLEIASREFEQEFRKILHRAQEKTIRDKLLDCLEKWALNEFKIDPQLNLIPSMYNKLKQTGVEFPSQTDESPSKVKKHGHKSKSHSSSSGGGSSSSVSNSSAAAVAAKEAEDLAKAIELSLKESQQQTPKSLYPQAALSSGGASASNSSSSTTAPAQEARKVRALYDFEAAEDNELTFYSGEIVHVLDDTDPNWWEGSNQRGQGLFPANFVTADLSAEPPEAITKKSVQFKDEVVVKTEESEPEQVEIDEAKIDNALHLLHEADPTGETPDPSELAVLEDQVQQMGPLIDQELEKVDRRHAQLTILGKELVDALNLYHTLMRDPGIGAQQPTSMPYVPRMGMPPNMGGYGGVPPNSMQQVPPVSYPGYYPPPGPGGMAGPYGSLPPQGTAVVASQPGQSPQGMPQPQLPNLYGSPIPSQQPEYQNHGHGSMANHIQPQPQHNMYGGPIPQENGAPHQQQQPPAGIQSPPGSHHQMLQAPAGNSGYQL